MRLPVLLALLLLAAAPAAHATEVTYRAAPPCEKYGCENNEVDVRGGPEANRITIALGEGGTVVRDAGAALTTTAPCSVREDGSVLCPPSYPLVSTGEGDDEVVLPGSGVADLGPGDDRATGVDRASGGPGDDVLSAGTTGTGARLRGGPGADRLTGSEHPDVLDGEEGPDDVRGLGGDDVVDGSDLAIYDPIGRPPAAAYEETPARDVLDGGTGTDLLSYLRRVYGVRVSLVEGVAGTPGEGEVVAGFENVQGSRGADWLTGDDGPNAISGSSGADRIEGGGGDDSLRDNENIRGPACCAPDGSDLVYGGDGEDRILGGEFTFADGGAGDDDLTLGQFSQVRCGDGDDAVEHDGRGGVRIEPACERLAYAFSSGRVSVPMLHAAPGRRLVQEVACPPAGARCRFSLTVTRAGRTVARATARLRSGQRRGVVLRLPRMRRPAKLHVGVVVEPDRRGVRSFERVRTGYSVRAA